MADNASVLFLSASDLASRLEGFLKDYLKGKSEATVGTYRRALNEFERYHGARLGSPASARFGFRENDVAAYKRYLMEERELSQVSVSTYLTALRRLCEYLVARGDLDDNPARSVKGNRRPDQHSRGVLAEADVETLLDAVPRATMIGLRDRALVSLMVQAGSPRSRSSARTVATWTRRSWAPSCGCRARAASPRTSRCPSTRRRSTRFWRTSATATTRRQRRRCS